jgi:hypothetical protein
MSAKPSAQALWLTSPGRGARVVQRLDGARQQALRGHASAPRAPGHHALHPATRRRMPRRRLARRQGHTREPHEQRERIHAQQADQRAQQVDARALPHHGGRHAPGQQHDDRNQRPPRAQRQVPQLQPGARQAQRLAQQPGAREHARLRRGALLRSLRHRGQVVQGLLGVQRMHGARGGHALQRTGEGEGFWAGHRSDYWRDPVLRMFRAGGWMQAMVFA